MFRKLSRTLITVAAVACAVAVPAAVWAAPSSVSQPPVRVGPRQPFLGEVNGKSINAVIRVFCPGVVRFGHPLGHQTVRVALVVPPLTPNEGFTGSAGRSIEAWLTWPPTPTVVPTSSSPAFVDSFTSYVALPIPSRIIVPCAGPGQMLFLPAPGSATVKAATVSVRFATIARQQ